MINHIMEESAIIIITLVIISSASIAMNLVQWREKKENKKECDGFIADNARLEYRLEELKREYDNEKLHRKWAMGRIKNQQAVIDQLKSNKVTYKPRKEGNGHE